jgi:hypothetical protein
MDRRAVGSSGSAKIQKKEPKNEKEDIQASKAAAAMPVCHSWERPIVKENIHAGIMPQ